MFARAVLKFDLSNVPGLPGNANIIEISLSIYYLQGDTGDGTGLCTLFTISKYWNSSEVTWNNATATDTWEQLDLDTKFYDADLQDTVQYPGGGDRNFPHIAVSPIAKPKNTWETYTITEAIREYIKNPSTFYGLYLKPYMSNGGRWYASSDHTEQEKRPKLTIRYDGTDIISNPKQKSISYNLIKATPLSVQIYVPLPDDYQVDILNLNGRILQSFNGYGKKWYQVPKEKLGNGVTVLQVTNGNKKIVQSFLLVK